MLVSCIYECIISCVFVGLKCTSFLMDNLVMSSYV